MATDDVTFVHYIQVDIVTFEEIYAHAGRISYK